MLRCKSANRAGSRPGDQDQGDAAFSDQQSGGARPRSGARHVGSPRAQTRVAPPSPVESAPLAPPPGAISPAQTPPPPPAAVPETPPGPTPVQPAPALPGPVTPQPVQPAPSLPGPAEPQPVQPPPSLPPPGQPLPPVPPQQQTGAPNPNATLAGRPGDASDVDQILLVAKPVLALAGQSSWDRGFETLVASFRILRDEASRAGLAIAGRPLTLFVETDDNGFRFEAMLPVDRVPESAPAAVGMAFAPASRRRGRRCALSTMRPMTISIRPMRRSRPISRPRTSSPRTPSSRSMSAICVTLPIQISRSTSTSSRAERRCSGHPAHPRPHRDEALLGQLCRGQREFQRLWRALDALVGELECAPVVAVAASALSESMTLTASSGFMWLSDMNQRGS